MTIPSEITLNTTSFIMFIILPLAGLCWVMMRHYDKKLNIIEKALARATRTRECA